MVVQNTLASLQAVIAQSIDKDGSVNLAKLEAASKDQSFAFPELAKDVALLLHGKGTLASKVPPEAEVAEAVLAWLQQPGKAESLGQDPRANPWIALREAARHTGANITQAFSALFETARRFGLGFDPSLLSLNEMVHLHWNNPQAAPQGWPAAVLAALIHFRKELGPPSDDEMEEFWLNATFLKYLKSRLKEGPWSVYQAQARVLRMLRDFGAALVDLDEEVNGGS